MSDIDFEHKWSLEFKAIRKQVLLWELPWFPQAPLDITEESVSDYLTQAKPYLTRGQRLPFLVLNRSLKASILLSGTLILLLAPLLKLLLFLYACFFVPLLLSIAFNVYFVVWDAAPERHDYSQIIFLDAIYVTSLSAFVYLWYHREIWNNRFAKFKELL